MLSNRGHLLPWLDVYAGQINALRQLLADGDDRTGGGICEQAIEARRQWLPDRHRQFSEDTPLPSIEKPNLLHQIVPRRLLERR